MTTYLITAQWGSMQLTEEMDITSDLSQENEMEYCKNFILEKWVRLFGRPFFDAADVITAKETAGEIFEIAPLQECS
jgi:hypothetical protein